MRVPNILVVTDIGADYDDFMALLILGHHHKAGKIRLLGVITTLYPVGRRARLALGLLQHMGITDVPVAIGSEGPQPGDSQQQAKDESKEQPKNGTREQPKDNSKAQPKDSSKAQPKDGSQDQAKENTKDQSKDSAPVRPKVDTKRELADYEDQALKATFMANRNTRFQTHLELARDIFAKVKQAKQKLRLLSIASLKDTWDIYQNFEEDFLALIEQVHAQGGCQLGDKPEAPEPKGSEIERQATSNLEHLKAAQTIASDKSAPSGSNTAGPPDSSTNTTTRAQAAKARNGVKNSSGEDQITAAQTTKTAPKENTSSIAPAKKQKITQDTRVPAQQPAEALRPRVDAKNNSDDPEAARKFYQLVQDHNIHCTAYNKEAATRSMFPVTIFQNDPEHKHRPKHMSELADYLFHVHSVQKKRFYLDSLKPWLPGDKKNSRFLAYMDREWYIEGNTLGLPKKLEENENCSADEVMPYSLVTPYDPIAALGCIGDVVGNPVEASRRRVRRMEEPAQQFQVKWGVDGVKIAEAIQQNLNEALMTK